MADRLIMGAAVGYGVEELRVLLRSAALNVPSADVLLMTDRNTPEFLGQLREIHPRVRLAPVADARWRADLWRSSKRRRKLTRLRPSRARRLAFWLHTPWHGRGLAAFHPASAKHHYAWDALRGGHTGDAREILLVDTRDLLFQADPFEDAPLPPRGLLMAAEPRGISAETHIYALFRRIDSSRTADALLGRPVLCAGAVLGRTPDIARYLRAMTRELNRRASHCFGRFIDQPFHCKVLHADQAVPFTALNEGNPWLTNLLYLKGNVLRVDESGVRTPEGELVRIVHRFDRFPRLAEWAVRRYGVPGAEVSAPFEAPLPFPEAFRTLRGCRSWVSGSPRDRLSRGAESSAAPAGAAARHLC